MNATVNADYVVEWFNREGIQTNEADWKLISEQSVTTSAGPEPLRYFENSVVGATCWALGEDDDYVTFWEGGDIYYDVGHDSDMAALGAGDYFFFVPKSFWDRNGYIPDWHTSEILPHVTSLGSGYFTDEMQENMYALPQHKTIADLHRDFQAAGLTMKDMSLAGATGANSPTTPSDDYGQVSRNSPPVGSIIDAMARGLEGENCEAIENGEIDIETLFTEVAEKGLNGAERDAAIADLKYALRQVGLEAFGHRYAEADKDTIVTRLKSAASDPINRSGLGTAEQLHHKEAQAGTEPPADLTGMSNHEIYRNAIRGLIPQIAAIGWCWDDVENRQGPATDDELAFYCGYLGFDGRLIKDLIIPDDVFERILPEYGKMTWNDYEAEGATNYHTMPAPDAQYIDGVRSHIIGRFNERNYRNDPAIMLPPFDTLEPSSNYVSTIDDGIDLLDQEDDSPFDPVQLTATTAPAPAPITPAGVEPESDEVAAYHYSILDDTGPVALLCLPTNASGEVVDDPNLTVMINEIFSEYVVETVGANTFKIRPLFGQKPAALVEKVHAYFKDRGIEEVEEQF